MREQQKCCGTCKHHQQENITDGFVCVNDESDYVADWTDEDHTCDAWEDREEW